MRDLPEAESALHVLREEICNVCEPVGLDTPKTIGGADGLVDLLQCLAKRPMGADEAAEPLLEHVGQLRMTEALAAGQAWRAARERGGDRFLGRSVGCSGF